MHTKGNTMAPKPISADMHPGPGYRTRKRFDRLDVSLMSRFRAFDVPDISDQLNRLYAVDPKIACLTGDHPLCGPICTVRVFPGDNLMVHKVLDLAQPGDIVVVDARGSNTNAVLGDLVCAKAQHRGIAGFVVDGLIRDLPAILELDFPVYARGTTTIGPLHRGPGEINYPIACGGVVANPGDAIVADGAGMVIIPRDAASDLLDRLNKQAAQQADYLAAVRRGEFSNEWVDRLLKETGCLENGDD